MQVTSYLCRFKRLRRGPVAAGLLLWFASIAGVAQATEFITGFDEKLKAPMAMGATELKSRRSELFRQFRAVARALTRGDGHEQGALSRALRSRVADQPRAGRQAAAGRSVGTRSREARGWLPHRLQRVSAVAAVSGDALLAGAHPDMDAAGPLLINRGFRDSDVAALRSYIETHDLKAATSARTLPIAISFSKVVKKYDKIKRPVGKGSRVLVSLPARQGRSRSAARLVRRSHPHSRRSARARTPLLLHGDAGHRLLVAQRCRSRSRKPVGRHETSGLRTTRNGRSPRSDAMKAFNFTSRCRAMLLSLAALLGAPQPLASAVQMSVYPPRPASGARAPPSISATPCWLPPIQHPQCRWRLHRAVQSSRDPAHDWRTGLAQLHLRIRQNRLTVTIPAQLPALRNISGWLQIPGNTLA